MHLGDMLNAAKSLQICIKWGVRVDDGECLAAKLSIFVLHMLHALCVLG
jgi:hypothetical protein